MRRYAFGIPSALLSFALGLACASLASAATPRPAAPKSAEDDGVVEPRSASPYEIARAFRKVNAKPEAERWGARVELASTWKRLGITEGEFSRCPAGCEAEVGLYELDGRPGREAVLRLNYPHNAVRYLVYGRAGRRWRLLGFVDHDFNRYADSTYYVGRARGGQNRRLRIF